MRRRSALFFFILAALTAAILPGPKAESRFAPGNIAAIPPQIKYEIVRRIPHDTSAFTQGLLFRDGYLYESTGLYGRSSLRKIDLDSGIIIDSRSLDSIIFAEGISSHDSVIVQLSWRSGRGFVYSWPDFRPLREFTYRGEGWGLTWDGARYIMSDGSSTLRFLDPVTYQPSGSLDVLEAVEPYPAWREIPHLNELEFINGEIFANVWKSDLIAVINPDNGRVTGWIDLSGLLTPEETAAGVDVLNGIAYDADNDRLFVTGKLWPWIFHIRLKKEPDHGTYRGAGPSK